MTGPQLPMEPKGLKLGDPETKINAVRAEEETAHQATTRNTVEQNKNAKAVLQRPCPN